MKSWVIESYGLNGLKQKEVPIVEPNENQILVKVSTVSLNFRDHLIINGGYVPKIKDEINIGLTPASDLCGHVVKVGSNVKNVQVNDRVLSHFYTKWIEGKASNNEFDGALGGPLNGVLSEYVVLEGNAFVKAPEYLTDIEGSTLPIAALTAWYALITEGNLKKDEFVLIQGTGGVSIFALQIANSIGAKTILLTSSNEKAELVKKLGADHVINYKENPDWVPKVLELTNGNGVEHVVDVVGGESFIKSLDALRTHGHIHSVGVLGDLNVTLTIPYLFMKRVNIHGIGVGSVEKFIEMNKSFEHYKIKPVIAAVYQFNDAPNAFKHLEKGPFGKIVIQL